MKAKRLPITFRDKRDLEKELSQRGKVYLSAVKVVGKRSDILEMKLYWERLVTLGDNRMFLCAYEDDLPEDNQTDDPIMARVY